MVAFYLSVCLGGDWRCTDAQMLKLGGDKDLSLSLGIDVFVLVAECAVHRASAIHDSLG